jgi:hypothetical protein
MVELAHAFMKIRIFYSPVELFAQPYVRVHACVPNVNNYKFRLVYA